ncbi:NTP transferase domain-containing protein [Ruminococcus sp. OA3]|uniref:NTP transferase domain-containing protein n=1 Tax=Ruminococcus sp. OA3 TaxID=2914164 RepID=UPI001F066475|nr:NTP transferase domain-containing protein [Ruminococcus sp. OA3]MCH1982151.1 NTP transferase domain-containing protein [Ruminococcus sp. OA3]
MHTSKFNIDNAVILAAGFASRFAPLSRTTPKALLTVRGEVLIERQIRQLQEAGIRDIYIVTGYLKKQFEYLPGKWNVTLIENKEYQERNNHSSVWAARRVLANTFICSSDNYFPDNPFSRDSTLPYYSALYAQGPTDEYCLTTDSSGRITDVQIGGRDSWYMLGHVLFNTEFSNQFLQILEAEYDLPATKNLMWENIYMKHLAELTLYMKEYPDNAILEFDTLDELCLFDPSYCSYRDSLEA